MPVKKLRSGQWVGSYVVRGGSLKDKHGNVKKSQITLRQRSSGIVVDKFGNFLGYEKPFKHHYSRDERRGKKPKGWHGESIRHQLAAKGVRTGRRG